MVHLRLTGLSEDGTRLLLVSDAGVEFTIDVDARLRAALSNRAGGDQARLGQLEIQMDSTLRPRDIQARIRAGESPETVAQVAGTPVDKVMPYAAPVLAERLHVAQRAQRASVRRRPTDASASGSARTLGDAVASHLRSRNVDPDTVTWDAWRREDSRWTLTGSFAVNDRVGAAHFSFDSPGNYVVADDDDAHWLLGESADATSAPAPTDDLQGVRQRRLSAVPPDELPLGEDAIELVSEPDPAPAARAPDEDAALGAEQPLEAYLDDDTATQPAVPATEGADADESAADDPDDSDDSDDSDEPVHEMPTRKPVKKTRGRASVPSWDEIMFGGGSSEE